MILEADVKGLEIVGVALLSKDKILTEELLNKEDIHFNNQKAFKLSTRLVAKRFKFRMIYGGTEYGFAKDPDFKGVNEERDALEFWKEKKSQYYEKYFGIATWHEELLKQAKSKKPIVLPNGRYYTFEPQLDTRFNRWRYPETNIKNYPVQGFSHDLFTACHIITEEILETNNIPNRIINSVHDSLILDIPDNEVDLYIEVLDFASSLVPEYMLVNFQYEMNIPLTLEYKVGKTWGEVEEYKKKC